RYALSPEGYYHPRHGWRLKGVQVVDAGDVDIPTLNYEQAFERITAAARALRQRVQLPLYVGGDHSISYPLLLAYDEVPDLHVVQLDAHLDFSDERDGTRFSNSSPFRRAVEALPNLQHITTIGLRGVRFDPEAVQAAQARGHTLLLREDLPVLDPTSTLPEGKLVYLSIDVDALDPTLLPATSSPEPDGLSFSETARLIQLIAQRNMLVGVDLVELTPHLDPSGNSALIAVRLLLEVMMACYQAP
ncbi:MAG: arginase family protein, partial [Fimbriimonadales bacterium]|nr:arginase family protein [Fimbriimonadales bacterium]